MISAWDKSIELLSRAELSAPDLKRKLQKKGYDRDSIETTLEKLYEYGYLDDERYAEAYIRKYIWQRSEKQILRELKQKGIELSDPEELISEVYDEEACSESRILEQLISRKLRGNETPDQKELNRLYAYLQRRGFSYHLIRRTLQEMPVTEEVSSDL